MRTPACLLLLAAAAMAAGCGPPAPTAADPGVDVKAVHVSVGTRAWFDLDADGKAGGGHMSGDPEHPFVHLDEKQLTPEVVRQIMDLAGEVYRSPACSETEKQASGWYITIEPASGPAKHYLQPQDSPYADTALECLRQLLLKNKVGGW
jgi:hypothetical protein